MASSPGCEAKSSERRAEDAGGLLTPDAAHHLRFQPKLLSKRASNLLKRLAKRHSKGSMAYEACGSIGSIGLEWFV